MGDWKMDEGHGLKLGQGIAALDALRTALRSEDARVRSQAARAIGYMGPEAAEAAPDLVRLVAKGSDAREALNALAEIGEAAVPHIMELLKKEEEMGRAVADALHAIASQTIES